MTNRAIDRRIVVATLLWLVMVGCGGSGTPSGTSPSPTPGTAPPLANGSFSALIDGANFNATTAAVVTGGSLVSIGGGNASGQTLGFAWLDVGTGTYPIGGATIGSHTFMRNTWSASSAQGSGSITVTTKTANRVAGTFSFVLAADAPSGATGTRNITQGRFDLTF